jgi:hypothetical protein
MMINPAGVIAFSMWLVTLKASGKTTSGRKRAFRRWESSSAASAGVRAHRLAGMFFRARIMPRVVPQVVAPTTAIFWSTA